MTENPTQRFASALQQLETSRDVAAFAAAVFADDPELVRGETGRQQNGPAGAETFWRQYLDQFDDITSEFTRIAHSDIGILEWTSRGHLTTGAAIEYRGVSLLDFTPDGHVTRFATYYDTAAFTV